MLKKTAVLAALTFILQFSLIGADDMDSIRFSALDINIGPRASSMAGAFTALSDDCSAVYYNPAGLSAIKMIDINAAFNKWFMDASFQYGYLAVPVGYGAIAGMFTYTDFGTFIERDGSGISGSEIKPNNISIALAYGAPIGDIFSAGIGFKFANMGLEETSVSDFLFDFGIRARIMEVIYAGAMIQNLDTVFSDGYNVRAGLGGQVFNINGNTMYLEADVKYSGAYGLSYAAGVEFQLFRMLSIRGGYNIRGENSILSGISGLSLGAGITIDKITFDYAFMSRGELGMTHLAGIRFMYEGSEEKEKRNYQKLTEFLAYQSFKDGEEAFEAGNYKRALAYWEEVKSMMPEYEGLNEAIAKANAIIKSGGSIKRIETTFRQGMTAYENFDFDTAVKKWQEVKKVYPSYKDIDMWLRDAKELKASKGMSKQAEKYFREGIKYYNDCDYDKAISSWEKGLAKDPKNKKIEQYIDRTRAKRLEMKEGISKARADVANDSTIIAGIKRLRDISNTCPAYQDAADILSTLKGMIAVKTRDYYFKGIEKYTEGNLDAAIIYWTNIEALDPKSEYLIKVKRYITDARNKQKAIKGFEQKKKK